MLSLFPYLLVFERLAPLLLRLTLGIILVYWSYKRFKKPQTMQNRAFSAVEGIAGILLIIGLYTQIAALVAAVILAGQLAMKIRSKAFFTDGVNYYFILFVISLSLLLTGPGAFAFDLPL